MTSKFGGAIKRGNHRAALALAVDAGLAAGLSQRHAERAAERTVYNAVKSVERYGSTIRLAHLLDDDSLPDEVHGAAVIMRLVPDREFGAWYPKSLSW